MGARVDTQAVGLDVGLAMIRWLTGAESLHYGVWTGLEVTAGNLRAAQDAYTDRLLALMPPGPLRILDIGGGAGWTARRLLADGHEVEIVVPSAYLADRCRLNAPGATIHECRFEDLGDRPPFDLCLFSESFQYIPLAAGVPGALARLRPGGEILIADCFRSDAFRGRAVSGAQPGGGHSLRGFRAALADWPVDVLHEDEITDAVAPSIDLEQGLFNVAGLAVTRTGTELSARRPKTAWCLRRMVAFVLPAKKRARLMQRLCDRDRTAEAFRRYNHYMLWRLRKR